MLDKLPEGLFCQIQKCGDRIVSLSQQLIENCTSNAAENFMAVNTKFNGGKQINRMQKGSFEHRCHGAALSFQKGAGWQASMRKRCTEQQAGPVLNKYCDSISLIRKADRERLSTEKSKKKRRLSKQSKTSIREDNHYGNSAQQPDIDQEELQRLCNENAIRMQVSDEERSNTEMKTRAQRNCGLWVELRKGRLTSSRFGEVCKRRKSTPCERIVKDILHSSSPNSQAINWGITHEDDAVKTYQSMTGNTVSPAGLFLSLEQGFLGASPDGIARDVKSKETGLLEVKYPHSAITQGKKTVGRAFTLQEAASSLKSFPVKFDKTGKLSLTKKSQPLLPNKRCNAHYINALV